MIQNGMFCKKHGFQEVPIEDLSFSNIPLMRSLGIRQNSRQTKGVTFNVCTRSFATCVDIQPVHSGNICLLLIPSLGFSLLFRLATSSGASPNPPRKEHYRYAHENEQHAGDSVGQPPGADPVGVALFGVDRPLVEVGVVGETEAGDTSSEKRSKRGSSETAGCKKGCQTRISCIVRAHVRDPTCPG